jgi:Holliday junction resolvasome RuvABC endonuclease subunit
MSYVLGLDVSSTTVGWCILDINLKTKDVKFIKCSYLKPNKKGTIFDRLELLKKDILIILKTYKPVYVAIEEITQFMPRFSSANTIITLAVFNRMVGLTVKEYTGKNPEMVSVMAIRHALKQTKELPKKEDMPELVKNTLGIIFPYEYKKNGKMKVENEDMADACAVALYFAFKLTNRLEKIKTARDLLQ